MSTTHTHVFVTYDNHPNTIFKALDWAHATGVASLFASQPHLARELAVGLCGQSQAAMHILCQ